MKQYSSKGDIKCAVIGYGGAFNMGELHLKQMQAQGLVPTAVAEIDPERLKVAEKDFPGIATFGNVEEMLETARPDLVAIITPHNTHAELAMSCLKAGAHVVCEKPMAITLEEADAMIAVAAEKGLVLSVYHNRHWDGRIVEAVRRIRDQGEIGEIFRIEAHMGGYNKPGDWWRSSRSISGGVHYDWGVHLLEYSLQLIDSELVEVSGFKKSGFWETCWGTDTNQDEVSIISRFRNGTLLNLRITHLDAKGDPNWLVITGSKGVYTFDNNGYSIHKQEGTERHTLSGRNPEDQHGLYYANLASALVGEEELVISAEWSRKTMEILDLGSRSADENRAIRVRD